MWRTRVTTKCATGLAARERAEITLDRGKLDLEQVDHLQRHTDPLTRVDRELQTGEELRPASVRRSSGAPAIPW